LLTSSFYGESLLMAEDKLTPFEQAVCAWILKLPGTWTQIDWDALTATHEKAFSRLIKGGLVEARLPMVVRIDRTPGSVRMIWRVTGQYSDGIDQSLRDHLTAMGHGDKGAHVVCEQFTFGRLTHEGELARRDFQGDHPFKEAGDTRPGLPRMLFDLIAGGPDGEGGIRAPGIVRLESSTVEQHQSTPPTSAPPTAAAHASAQATVNVDMSPLARALAAVAEAIGRHHAPVAPGASTTTPPSGATSKADAKEVTPAGKQEPKEPKPSRPKSQEEVDAALETYLSEHAQVYQQLLKNVQDNLPNAIEAARELFGRNVLASKIGCRSPWRVTESPVYQKIQLELRLLQGRTGEASRSGFDMSVEKVSEKSGNVTFDAVVNRETCELIVAALPRDVAEAMIHQLEIGETTDEKAREMIELYQQQRADSKSPRARRE
jgi:hypothetical protein